MDSEPRYFAFKKWTLVTLMALNALLWVIYAFYSDESIKLAMKNDEFKDIKPEDLENVKQGSKIFFIVICVIAAGFEIFFIYWAIKRNICLCTTYAVIAVLVALFYIIKAMSQPIFWLYVCFAVVKCVVAIIYLRELKFIERNPQNGSRK